MRGLFTGVFALSFFVLVACAKKIKEAEVEVIYPVPTTPVFIQIDRIPEIPSDYFDEEVTEQIVIEIDGRRWKFESFRPDIPDDVGKEEGEEIERLREEIAPENWASLPPEIEKEERWFLGRFGYFDVPVELNREVQYYIDFFTKTDYRKVFKKWLERSSRYIPLLRRILVSEGLPEDMVYLAMIESGFSNYAVSPRGAVGIWQFIKGTAKRYGLRIDWWVDERRDPVKATRAAARYLKDLYRMFGDWYLAMAAYNAGERKIERAIKRAGTRDYWYLARKRFIPRETSQYVPRMIAAAIITKNPELFGFDDVRWQEPLTFDQIVLERQYDIWTLAWVCGCSVSELRELNPHLKRWVTPPYPIHFRVPLGKGELVKSKLRELGIRVSFKPKLWNWTTRRTRRYTKRKVVGWLYWSASKSIRAVEFARIFNLSYSYVKKYSRNGFIKPGVRVKVPVWGWTPGWRWRWAGVRVKYKNGKLYYTVRRGDSLYKIAKMFGTSVKAIMRANGLKSTRIYPGQKLVIPTRGKKVVYVVKKGDTLYEIARKFGVSIRKIRAYNGIRGSKIYPGQKLVIPLEG